MQVLLSRRLRFETWREQDWVAFYPIASDLRVIKMVGSGKPWSEAQTQKWVKQQMEHQEQDGFCRFKMVRKQDHFLVGWCGFDYFGDTGDVELGYWVRPECWGEGLATEAAGAVLCYGRENLGLDRVISVCHVENKASERIMQKIGLTLEQRTNSEALGLDVSVPVVVYAG